MRRTLLVLFLLGIAANYALTQRTPPTTTAPPSTYPILVTGSRPPARQVGCCTTIIGGDQPSRTVPVASTPTRTTTTTRPPTTAPRPRRSPVATTVPVVVRSNTHSCTLVKRRLACQGLDNHGQVRGALLAPDAREVVLTDGVTCVRSMSREVWCWGYRMGGPNAESTDTPMRVDVPPSSKLYVGPGGTICSVTLASGGLNQRGEDDPGDLWCWGEGVDPELGYTGQTWTATPTLIQRTHDFDKVAIGWRMMCTLTGEVELTCFGALPDGTQEPRGRVIARNKQFRTIRIERIQQRREVPWVGFGGTTEYPYW